MRIMFSKTAKKDIEKLPKDYKELIHKGILDLTKIPPVGDIKPLQGSKNGQQRLRIGKYRILFQYIDDPDGEYLYINAVGVRGDVYK